MATEHSSRCDRAIRNMVAAEMSYYGLPVNQIITLTGLNEKTVREIRQHNMPSSQSNHYIFRELFPCGGRVREHLLPRELRSKQARLQATLFIATLLQRHGKNALHATFPELVDANMVAAREWNRCLIIEEFTLGPKAKKAPLKRRRRSSRADNTNSTDTKESGFESVVGNENRYSLTMSTALNIQRHMFWGKLQVIQCVRCHAIAYLLAVEGQFSRRPICQFCNDASLNKLQISQAPRLLGYHE